MALLPSSLSLGERPVPRPQNSVIDPRNIGAAEGMLAKDAMATADLGQTLGKASDLLIKVQEENDKAAATSAYLKGAQLWTEQSLKPGGIYGKTPTELYGNGATTQQLFDLTKKDMTNLGDLVGKDLKTDEQRKIFNTLWQRHMLTEGDSVAKSLAERHRTFREDTRKAIGKQTEKSLDELSLMAETSWQNPTVPKQKAAIAIGSFAATGAAPDDVQAVTDYATKVINSSVVRGWFNSQPDRLGALEQVVTGKFDDKRIADTWALLKPSDRDALRSRLATDAARIATVQNQQDKEREDAEKEADLTTLKATLYDPTLSDDQRNANAARLMRSPHITEGQAKALDQAKRSGWRDSGVDIDEQVLLLNREIRNGTITTDVGVLDWVGNHGGVSSETVSKTFLPLVQQMNDRADTALTKDWNDNLTWGQSLLGYDSKLANSGFVIDKDVGERAMLFQADMLEYRRLNPKGDPKTGSFHDYAEKRVSELRKMASTKAASTTTALVLAYQAALRDGSPAAKLAARNNLMQNLIQRGAPESILVDETFDPLAYMKTNPFGAK